MKYACIVYFFFDSHALSLRHTPTGKNPPFQIISSASYVQSTILNQIKSVQLTSHTKVHENTWYSLLHFCQSYVMVIYRLNNKSRMLIRLERTLAEY